jgi:hypothetical protein
MKLNMTNKLKWISKKNKLKYLEFINTLSLVASPHHVGSESGLSEWSDMSTHELLYWGASIGRWHCIKRTSSSFRWMQLVLAIWYNWNWRDWLERNTNWCIREGRHVYPRTVVSVSYNITIQIQLRCVV